MLDFEETDLEAADDVALFEPEPLKARGKQVLQDGARSDMALKMLKQAHEAMGHAIELLSGGAAPADAQRLAELIIAKKAFVREKDAVAGTRVLEGVFDGSQMVGSDGRRYTVPPNYASKSRLVEGDMMKLTIQPDGSFLFKQIGPVERRRMTGELLFDREIDQYVVNCNDVLYRVLTASVTYYKGQPGDEAVILVPKGGQSTWAAVENIVKK